jgi:glycerate-2-kinase
MPCPAPGITLEDKQNLIRKLLASGTDIAEVNVLRKRLSSSKGGGLGRHFSPATVVSLIVSDVIGNDLAAIGSGPTFAEDLSNCFNHIICDSGTALEAMKHEAVRNGKRVLILGNTLKGEPEPVAREIAENILAGKYSDYDVLLAAGETTPVLPPNPGRGGRNQHFAASTLLALEKFPRDWTHVSLGSDGSDYLPDVAGAMVDPHTLQQVRIMGLSIRDYLDRFDTYGLLKKTGHCLIETGPTGTNVGDLMIYVLR